MTTELGNYTVNHDFKQQTEQLNQAAPPIAEVERNATSLLSKQLVFNIHC